VIDLHSHVLPGVDDGASSLEESVEMARAAVDDGIWCLAATPHVRDDYPTSADEMEALVAEVQAAVDREGLRIKILRGGELALERLDLLALDELRRYGLGGNPRYLLLEFPYTGWPLGVEERVFALRTRSFVPVLAHPERNREVQADPERLDPLVRSGCLVQVTAASLDGRLGRSSTACARTLVDVGLAHLLASDAHLPEVRQIGMSAAAGAVGDDELAHWLTVDVPRAIVEDRPVPPRPDTEPRRRQSGFLSRLRGAGRK
jgi:protein-tyrosine phosphatase